jgi:hypothetical protein
VPIFLSCKDRSTKPIGRAIFGARAFMLSGRYTWRGYAVSGPRTDLPLLCCFLDPHDLT